MAELTLWHNPRCSKSRQALALLEDRGADFQVRRYLDEGPDVATLKAVLAALGLSDTPWKLVRSKEAIAKELGMSAWPKSDDAVSRWVDAMVAHPKLIERPLLVAGNKAVIGRPPEDILTLL